MIQDLHKIIGEITIENNFLKKVAEITKSERIQMIDFAEDFLSIRQQCHLLGALTHLKR